MAGVCNAPDTLEPSPAMPLFWAPWVCKCEYRAPRSDKTNVLKQKKIIWWLMYLIFPSQGLKRLSQSLSSSFLCSSPLFIFFFISFSYPSPPRSLSVSLLHSILLYFAPRQIPTSWWQNGCQQLQASVFIAPEKEVYPPNYSYRNPIPCLGTHQTTCPSLSQSPLPRRLDLLAGLPIHTPPPTLEWV